MGAVKLNKTIQREIFEVVGRHWAVFEVEKLVKEDGYDRLYQTLLKTREKMMEIRLQSKAS